MTAVFTSTRQALHVSFLLEVMPATAKSQMQMVIEQMMRHAGISEELERHERTIDFRGLSPLEVRGQCAMVCGVVRDHLAEPERGAVWTKYGMRRRQVEGVQILAEYIEPMLTVRNRDAHQAMIWGRFGREINRDVFSIRKIASELGLHATTVARDQQKIVQVQRALEGKALMRLDSLFESTGLIEGSVATRQQA